MIDPAKPMELDDGTPVTFEKLQKTSKTYVLVTLPEGVFPARPNVPREDHSSQYRYFRDPDNVRGWDTGFAYDLETGVFGGGDAERFFVLRNIAPGRSGRGSLLRRRRKITL